MEGHVLTPLQVIFSLLWPVIYTRLSFWCLGQLRED